MTDLRLSGTVGSSLLRAVGISWLGSSMAEVTRIPFAGTANSGSIRTGPMQIGDDWPGFFVRGDEFLGSLRPILRAWVRDNPKPELDKWTDTPKAYLEALSRHRSARWLLNASEGVEVGDG